MAKTNNDVPEMDMPDIAGASEDVFLDFSDIDAVTGFEPLAPGWYPVVITGFRAMEVTKLDGTLPAGTKGTNFEFTVMEGHPNQNRKFFNSYWHSKSNLPYLKGLAITSGKFTADTLNKVSYDQLRDGLIGSEFMARVTVVPENKGFAASNKLVKIKEYDPSDMPVDSSDMP